ncbi:MAG TPA: membrane protein insertase YidC [Bryobacterales bacterium]|nr:membrane protein insertase YidC [Bryobacterales bacterium]
MNEDDEQKQVQFRALVAFALSALVLFLYEHYYVKPLPPRPAGGSPAAGAPAKSGAPASESAASAPGAATGKAEASASAPSEAPLPVTLGTPVEAAKQEQSLTVETDNYLVSFSNRGAVVKSWTLKHYEDEAGRPLELVNTAAVEQAGYPFSYAPATDLNQALFKAEESGGGAGRRLTAPVELTFTWSDGKLKARKTFRFEKSSYTVRVESDLVRDGAPAPHFLAWRGGFGDAAVEDQAGQVSTYYYDTLQGKVVKRQPKEAAKGPLLNAGDYLFAGIEDHFFAAAFINAQPGKPLSLETTALEASTTRRKNAGLFAGAAVGGTGDNRFLAYVGPKSLPDLRAVRPELAKLVDFGFFSFIAHPIFLMLLWTHRWVPNYGWAIVVLTVFINFALFPLKIKSMQSMKKMQKIQPLIKHINDKYKGLSMRDAKRQDQNKEVMELYQKYGVNPLGGCLPMVLQLPFFFAFYAVLRDTIDLRHAPWLWVHDLSNWDHIYLLPILMVVTQFLYQRMTPSTTGDPAQQKMMQFMPLVMGFFFFKLPSGLVLYWLTGNLVGVAQQMFINRLPEPELEIEKPKRGAKGSRQ